MYSSPGPKKCTQLCDNVQYHSYQRIAFSHACLVPWLTNGLSCSLVLQPQWHPRIRQLFIWVICTVFVYLKSSPGPEISDHQTVCPFNDQKIYKHYSVWPANQHMSKWSGTTHHHEVWPAKQDKPIEAPNMVGLATQQYGCSRFNDAMLIDGLKRQVLFLNFHELALFTPPGTACFCYLSNLVVCRVGPNHVPHFLFL